MKLSGFLPPIAVTLAALATCSPAKAEPLTLLDGPTQLRFIDSATPSTLQRTLTVTGMLAGETIAAIDYRPLDGTLYAIGFNVDEARLYTINTTTGAATLVGSGPFDATFGAGGNPGMDFNPVVDRIRVTSNLNRNLRLNPLTGAIAGTDTNTAFAVGDVNAGNSNAPLSVAYSNNVAGAVTTTLYGIVSGNGPIVVTIGSVNGTPVSPNTGTMFTVGSTGTGGYTSSRQGFDISGSTGIAYAVMDNNNTLYSINLATGAATVVGAFPAGTAIRDLSVGPAAAAIATASAVPVLGLPVLLVVLGALLLVVTTVVARRRT